MLASLALDALGLLGVARDPPGPVAAAGALGVVATTVGLTVAGQQLGSLLVDHWGCRAYPGVRPPAGGWPGVALLLAGVALIQLP